MCCIGMNICTAIRLQSPPRGRNRTGSIRNDWIRKFSGFGKRSSRTSDREECPWSPHCAKTLRRAVSEPKLTSCAPSLCQRWNTTHMVEKHSKTHLYVLTADACHSHIFKKSLVPHLNKHFLGPWSNNYGNNIQRPATTGIISALFINKVICEVSPTGGGGNMLTCSNGIWPNGNDILTAAICDAGAPSSCWWIVQHWGNTMKSQIIPPEEEKASLTEELTTSRQSTILLSLSSGRLASSDTLAQSTHGRHDHEEKEEMHLFCCATSDTWLKP